MNQPPPNYTPYGIAVPTLPFNAFWDLHTATSAEDVLNGQAQGYSCTVVCSQQYLCSGNEIGSFTITKTATHSALPPATQVTQVSATVQ